MKSRTLFLLILIGVLCLDGSLAGISHNIASGSTIHGDPTQQYLPTPITTNNQWKPVTRVFAGVEMVLVPAGCYKMGSSQEVIDYAFELGKVFFGAEVKREWFAREGPAHQICFVHAFWIDKYEVSNEQFSRLGGQAELPSKWTGIDRPRERLTWFEARDFCAGRGMGLPTEAQWEYAARGPDGYQYPWGNSFIDTNVVFYSNAGGQTANIGSKPDGASWVGAQDMSGNVWEWVADWYSDTYYATSPQIDPQGPVSGLYRVERGGSWYCNALIVRSPYRGKLRPDISDYILGFRCASPA